MQQYKKHFLKFHILELIRDVLLLTLLISSLFIPIFLTNGEFTYSLWQFLERTVLTLQTLDHAVFNIFAFLELNWAYLLAVILYNILVILLIVHIIRGIATFIDFDLYAIKAYKKISGNPRHRFASHFRAMTLFRLLLLSSFAFVVVMLVFHANSLETVTTVPEYISVYFGAPITTLFTDGVISFNAMLILPLCLLVLIVTANAMMRRVRQSIKLQAVYDKFHSK